MSSDESKGNSTGLTQNSGLTPAERYLASLAKRTFLSLWRYPGLFREAGKELCDLLVVFENDIVIFSDKDCAFPSSGNVEVDWGRWLRKAVHSSVKQLLGAKRWIEKYPDRLFLDAKCTQRFPLELPPMNQARIHLVAVVHGVAKPCADALGGSGSLMINTLLQGGDAHVEPFMIGDLEPKESFVHVLDDTTLEVLLSTLDTVSDIVAYFRKKEAFLRGPKKVVTAGDEELLATYLTKMNAKGEHDFVFPEGFDMVSVPEGSWARFCRNPQRLAQIEANRISYAWDALIEEFNKSALDGTQYRAAPGAIASTEKIMRFMAREPRTRRRMLAEALIGALETTGEGMKRVRVIKPSNPGDPYYAFLLLAHLPGVPEEEYREVRSAMLNALCMVVKHVFPDALDIVGFATEAGRGQGGSEDAFYLDTRTWTEEMAAKAARFHKDLNLLTSPTATNRHVQEYPAPS